MTNTTTQTVGHYYTLDRITEPHVHTQRAFRAFHVMEAATAYFGNRSITAEHLRGTTEENIPLAWAQALIDKWNEHKPAGAQLPNEDPAKRTIFSLSPLDAPTSCTADTQKRPKLTNQEIFTKVYNHVLKQGKRATDGRGGCAYRGEGGTMCAVGCLIPDEAYDPVIENATVAVAAPGSSDEKALAMRNALDAAGLDWRDEDTRGFLGLLQGAHDNYITERQDPHLARWKDRMQEIACGYGLTVPMIEAR